MSKPVAFWALAAVCAAAGWIGAQEPPPPVSAPSRSSPPSADIPGFCDACQRIARGPVIESSAQCALCKTGWTASGAFKACDTCARQRNVCKVCLRPLNGSNPPPALKTPTIEEVQAKYGDDLIALRGVVGHGIGEVGGKPALTLMVENQEDAERLGHLLARVIEGYPLKIEVTGKVEAR